MRGTGRRRLFTDDDREKNDKHNLLVVIAVLASLAVYAYLFTHVADPLGVPGPADLAARLGLSIDHVFDSDRNVDSNVSVPFTQRFDNNDTERLVLYSIIAITFLFAYFLPVRWKRQALIFWSTIGIVLLYGGSAASGLLTAHLVVYLTLHPNKRNLWVSAIVGLTAYGAFLEDPELISVSDVDFRAGTLLLGLPVITAVVYRVAILRLLEVPRLAPLLRTVAVQSAILTIFISSVVEGLGSGEWALPLGVLLFFWQWERLILYHIDYKDGGVPKDITIVQYLAVFICPGGLPNWNWGVSIAQGYSYCENNFLCEDKNRLVLSGLKLWGIALLYLVFGDWLRYALVDFFSAGGVAVFNGYTIGMVRHIVRGGEVSTASVLVTSLLDLFRWTMLWGGVVHFKVGIWRVCGYGVDPYFNHPWLSTNLAALWSRFTFHYREFLVRAFYYPIFFRFFKNYPNLRVFAATMAAAAFGNMVWGHVTERCFYRGMTLENLTYELQKWPYYVLLGLGISLTQLYLLRRKPRRKPWTADQWVVLDLLATYCTLQYFALIRIFARPVPGSTIGDHLRLFLAAFGIHISS